MKLSFAQKLALPLILSLISLSGLSLYDTWQARQEGVEARKADLIHVSEIALGVIDSFGARASRGR